MWIRQEARGKNKYECLSVAPALVGLVEQQCAAPYSRLSAHDCHYCAYHGGSTVPEYEYYSAQSRAHCGAINVCIKPHLEQQGRPGTADVSGSPST